MAFGKNACGYVKRRESKDSYNSISSDLNPVEEKKKWPLWKMILVWSLAGMLVLVLLAFILIWVVVPIVFWLSIGFERFMIFIPLNVPKHPRFDQPEAYGIKGVFNVYISVEDYYNNKTLTSIGAWVILPDGEINTTTTTNIQEIIRDTKYDILIYLHGVAANRAKPVFQYGVFRKHFLVISVDHRGYGDSGLNVEMSEIGIVNDHLQIYDWVRRINSKNDIYYWGHSLGTGLSCHTLKLLKEQKRVVPKGLILESPFTTIAEEVVNTVIGKVFKWLPYFTATVLTPLDYNGFHFRSTTNIKSVDCPIMIFHAEDDNVIPYFLGKKLAEVASAQRAPGQGNVTFYLFPAVGYKHDDCTRNPALPQYITDFKRICQNYNTSTI